MENVLLISIQLYEIRSTLLMESCFYLKHASINLYLLFYFFLFCLLWQNMILKNLLISKPCFYLSNATIHFLLVYNHACILEAFLFKPCFYLQLYGTYIITINIYKSILGQYYGPQRYPGYYENRYQWRRPATQNNYGGKYGKKINFAFFKIGIRK